MCRKCWVPQKFPCFAQSLSGRNCPDGEMPSCVDDLVTAGLWGREVLFFEDDDRATLKTKIER